MNRYLCFPVALLLILRPCGGAAQAAGGTSAAQEPDHPVRVGSYLGASPWVISFGLDASVSLMPALDLVGSATDRTST